MSVLEEQHCEIYAYPRNLLISLVRKGGLEPPRALTHQILNLDRQKVKSYEKPTKLIRYAGFRQTEKVIH